MIYVISGQSKKSLHNANMTRLIDLRVGGILRGLVPGQSVTIRHVELHSEDVASVTYVGRVAGADTVTVTKNEILTALNKPDDFVLALVFVGANGAEQPRYLTKPFEQEPDFATASVSFRINHLTERAGDLRVT